MKDKQIAPASAEPRIFLVSALLHCVSMTALVYLRSSFGFGYLRPKSVFFAYTWAFCLYAVYVWMDGTTWQERHALLLFGGGAALLYWIHLLVAFVREWKQSGEHDQYSGTSHLIWLARRVGGTPSPRVEERLHLWGEPAVVLLLSGTSALIFGGNMLALWLCILAACLLTKEAFNHWYRVRQKKRQQDIFEDTGDDITAPMTSNLASAPPKATRKIRVIRTRNTDITGSKPE